VSTNQKPKKSEKSKFSIIRVLQITAIFLIAAFSIFLATITIDPLAHYLTNSKGKYEILFRNLAPKDEILVLTKLENYGYDFYYSNGIIFVTEGTRDKIMRRLAMDFSLPTKPTENIQFPFKRNKFQNQSEATNN